MVAVGGSLIELEGADDNLGSFSRTIDADFGLFSNSVESYTETLSGGGCTAIFQYTVTMNVR